MNTPERVPFPDKLVGWADIAKGLGELALHGLFDFIHHEPRSSQSEHYHPLDEGLENRTYEP